ncbi:putative metalloprotease CJM1_0395 family protein [Anaeromyxobacter paludicola]|uniref:SprA family protein n=1 Tax=Anaeromyxobacter paludicola TaxID=2918171 RepID=A0ABM7XAE2_9BACT|nr:putative metalloprotease CJM1_0395 family protein [Anaeromyxobacter paludicola]BDG08822.1 hypothetical protein AMPC_19350 [Anaeromyxobacter paludicola]
MESAISTSALQAAYGIATRDDPRLAAPAADVATLAAPTDRVTLSDEARAAAARKDPNPQRGGDLGKGDGRSLTPEQQAEVLKLSARDAHVRQHEAAHQAAGAGLTGGASFSYQTGPDGRSYAVGGEVPIRLAAGRTPSETIANARRVRAAALAPSDPSGADLSIASAASQLEQEAEAQERSDAAQGASGKARAATDAYARVATAA